jgi:hypothetical protein
VARSRAASAAREVDPTERAGEAIAASAGRRRCGVPAAGPGAGPGLRTGEVALGAGSGRRPPRSSDLPGPTDEADDRLIEDRLRCDAGEVGVPWDLGWGWGRRVAEAESEAEAIEKGESAAPAAAAAAALGTTVGTEGAEGGWVSSRTMGSSLPSRSLLGSASILVARLRCGCDVRDARRGSVGGHRRGGCQSCIHHKSCQA